LTGQIKPDFDQLNLVIKGGRTINLLLVRHSQSKIETNLSANNWKLSDEGRLRCQGLASKILEYRPTTIFSSPEPKALETARLIANSQPITVLNDLREHERYTVPFTSTANFRMSVNRLFFKPDELVFGNETADQAYERFSRAIDKVIQRKSEFSNVLITHGTVISLFVSGRIGLDPFDFWQKLEMPSLVVMNSKGSEVLDCFVTFK